MELRHLRYFVAVAKAGSLTVAADHILHTAQPSLSRQIRDLEAEVGVPLMTRSKRGVQLTAAGRIFLDHARLALAQVEAACVAARRAARPAKATFALGFLTGQEMEWLPRAMHILQGELPNIEVTVSSQFSPDLADALLNRTLDVAFLRSEPNRPDLMFKLLVKEPLVAVLPKDHPFATRDAIAPRDLPGQTYITVSNTAPVLRAIVDDYLQRAGIAIASDHAVDNLSMAISLVASTRGIALLPAYARNFLPQSVVSRPLTGEAPTIELMVAHHRANASPLLRLFMARIDELIPPSTPAPLDDTGLPLHSAAS